MPTAKTLIWLGRCPVWSESLLGAHAILSSLSYGGLTVLLRNKKYTLLLTESTSNQAILLLKCILNDCLEVEESQGNSWLCRQEILCETTTTRQKVIDSGMNFVSHPNCCFASLAGMASRCNSDQLPKSVRATLLQLLKTQIRLSDQGL